jgi:AmmeMemoRadiSam system protein B
MERSPAVAGLFYPAEPGSLRSTVAQYLDEIVVDAPVPVAIVVPHAGYAYSGRTAGRVYGAITVPEQVVLLGPNHTGLGARAAIWPGGSWRTPLGAVTVDEETAGELAAAHALLQEDDQAHLREHALEVQVPFLQTRCPGVSLVPVCLADCGLDTLLEMGQALARVLVRRGGRWLIVISSDMTHFASREEARRQDRLALDRLEEMDPAGLYATVRDHQITMCGVVPAVVGLAAAVELGARDARLVDYTCSGDVTGDDSDVVAYAGLTIA